MKSCPKCGGAWCRCNYVYEGPNGTPRSRADYSPDVRLRVPVNDKARSLLLQLERLAMEPQLALHRWADDGGVA